MKLKIRVAKNVTSKVEVINKPFSIKEAPGYKFFRFKSCTFVKQTIREFQTGKGINYSKIKKELIDSIKNIGFEEFDKVVKNDIKEHGVINK